MSSYSYFSRPRTLLLAPLFLALASLPATPLAAQVLEVHIEGTLAGHIANPAPQSGDSVIPGYERSWDGGVYPVVLPSPYGLPTASAPRDVLFGNRSVLIAGMPFSMSLFLDTRKFPAPDLGSNAAGTAYSDLHFGWMQSPVLQPYVPWMTGQITFNSRTQSYVADYSSYASLSDSNAIYNAAPPRSQGSFFLTELTSPIQPWAAGYYDTSGIVLQFDLPMDILNGTAFNQPLSFSYTNPAGISGVTGNFNVWETLYTQGGQRLALVQDAANFQVTTFSLRSFDPDAPVGGGVGATPVPEPSTYGLLGVGALGAAAWWRRRRRAPVLQAQ